MKLRLFAALLCSATLALTACERSSDVPQLQAEANGLVAAYGPRFDDLHRRAEDLMKRGRQLTGSVEGVADASGKLMAANRRLGELRQQVQQAPSTIANAAKAGHPEMARTLESLRAEFATGQTEVNGSLQTVEAWMDRAEDGAIAQIDKPLPGTPGATGPEPQAPAAAGTSTPPHTAPQPEPVGAAVQAPTTAQPQVHGGSPAPH